MEQARGVGNSHWLHRDAQGIPARSDKIAALDSSGFCQDPHRQARSCFLCIWSIDSSQCHCFVHIELFLLLRYKDWVPSSSSSWWYKILGPSPLKISLCPSLLVKCTRCARPCFKYVIAGTKFYSPGSAARASTELQIRSRCDLFATWISDCENNTSSLCFVFMCETFRNRFEWLCQALRALSR